MRHDSFDVRYELTRIEVFWRVVLLLTIMGVLIYGNG